MELNRLQKERQLQIVIETITDVPLGWFGELLGGYLEGNSPEDDRACYCFTFPVYQIQVNVVKSKAVKGKPKK